MLGYEKMGETVEYSKEITKSNLPERVLGKYNSGMEGPSLVISADVLGSEINGILAIRKVLDKLNISQIPIQGEIIGLAGNVRSQKLGLLKELKQTGFLEKENPFRPAENQGYNEAEEFVDLIEEYEKASRAMTTAVYYLDIKTCPHLLHPYICNSDNVDCIRFASHFPLYKIKGLEHHITDHIGFYLNAKRFIGCTLKVGSGDAYSLAQLYEAAIWVALVYSGCLHEKNAPDFNNYQNNLKSHQCKDDVESFEVIYKYTIQEDEFFRMIPGYQNFQKIKKGEMLATSDGGSIYSQWDGRVFMPLYHTECREGFFILKEIKS